MRSDNESRATAGQWPLADHVTSSYMMSSRVIKANAWVTLDRIELELQSQWIEVIVIVHSWRTITTLKKHLCLVSPEKDKMLSEVVKSGVNGFRTSPNFHFASVERLHCIYRANKLWGFPSPTPRCVQGWQNGKSGRGLINERHITSSLGVRHRRRTMGDCGAWACGQTPVVCSAGKNHVGAFPIGPKFYTQCFTGMRTFSLLL